MGFKCAESGRDITDPGEGIWEDGEWIGWDWINQEIEDNELKLLFPQADLQIIKVFEELVYQSAKYKEVTGRHLPIYGELGELFAEISFGIKRNRPRSQGSDGRLGNDFIEIKTISPENSSNTVSVKRQGNFNKLLVIKISETWEFEARMLDRKNMSKGKGKSVKVTWKSMKACELGPSPKPFKNF